MICLADNDILKKLAICDLLQEALSALQTSCGEVYVLESARFVLLKPIKQPHVAKARLGEAVFDRLSEFLGKVQVLNVTPSPAELALFDDILGIDAGEAVLFSATALLSNYLLATSDKKSLRALGAAANCEPIRQRLTHRVICFEQIILRLIDALGFEPVLTKVVPAVDCDTALRAVFGSGLEAQEQNVRRGLASYIGDLRKDTASILVEA